MLCLTVITVFIIKITGMSIIVVGTCQVVVRFCKDSLAQNIFEMLIC